MTVEACLRATYGDHCCPGDFSFYSATDPDGVVRADAGIVFSCPCGCGATLGVNFAGAVGPKWSWDGNREKPTVTPSIRHLNGCRWHGFLTAGVFTGQNE